MSAPLSGLRAWLVQRVSSVYMLAFLAYLLIRLVLEPVHDWESWQQWNQHSWHSAAVLMFFVSLLLHAWVGVRDVILDYVHHAGIRLLLLALVLAALGLQALWLLRILPGGKL